MNKETWELLPFWFPRTQNNQYWSVVFLSLIILSVDWWNWGAAGRFAHWLPVWVLYLLVVQFALAYSTWKFSKEWMKNE